MRNVYEMLQKDRNLQKIYGRTVDYKSFKETEFNLFLLLIILMRSVIKPLVSQYLSVKVEILLFFKQC